MSGKMRNISLTLAALALVVFLSVSFTFYFVEAGGLQANAEAALAESDLASRYTLGEAARIFERGFASLVPAPTRAPVVPTPAPSCPPQRTLRPTPAPTKPVPTPAPSPAPERTKHSEMWPPEHDLDYKEPENPRFLFVTLLAEAYAEPREIFGNYSFADLAMNNKRAFLKAAGNGIVRRCDTDIEDVENVLVTPLGNHFNKQRCVLYWLDKVPKSVEWISFMDGDTWFYNIYSRPEDFLEEVLTRYNVTKRDSRPDFLCSQDWKAINAGVIWFRKSEWTRVFLKRILHNAHGYSDQKATIGIMEREEGFFWDPDYKPASGLKDRDDESKKYYLNDEHILVLPYNHQWKLQAYAPSPVDWLVHTPGCKHVDNKGRGPDMNECLKTQLAYYCTSSVIPKLPGMHERCGKLQRELAQSQDFAWWRAGMFGWPLRQAPYRSLRGTSTFARETPTSKIWWDHKTGKWEKGSFPNPKSGPTASKYR